MTQMDSGSPIAPPTTQSSSPVEWLRKNLFSNWYNSILTVVCLLVLFQLVITFSLWIFTQAKWAVVTENLRLFFVGLYPQELYWRVWSSLGILMAIASLSWGFFQKGSRLGSRAVLVVAIVVAAVVFLPFDLTPRLWLLGIIVFAAVGVLGGAAVISGIW